MKHPFLAFLFLASLVGIGWYFSGGLDEIAKFDGKSMESLTALFSGLAFAGMIIAIVYQSNELDLQRQELKHTREELKRTAEANEKTAKLAQRNIEMQEEIAKNTIAAKRLELIIDYYYKEMEHQSHSERRVWEQYRIKIGNILDKFLELKGHNGAVIDDQTIKFTNGPSTPED